MIIYFFKRLFLFVPTLLLISLIIFFLSKLSSGDPVLNKLERESKELKESSFEELLALKKKMGLDLPHFYFSIYRKTACPNPNEFSNKKQLDHLEALAYQIGSWQDVETYYQEILRISKMQSEGTQNILSNLLAKSSVEDIQQSLKKFDQAEFSELNSIAQSFEPKDFSINNYLFSIQWNGFHNQYHHWISSLIRGNWGKSYIDGRAVSKKISIALYWTLILSSISIFLSFLIAIPTAVYSAAKPGNRLDRICSNLFFGFYALPTFWVATLLIVFFASGEFLKLFPTYGLGQLSNDASIWEMFYVRASHLMLPIICCTYGSLAFIYRQLRQSMQEELNAEYMKTARSKGLAMKQLLWNHAFRNASFPLLTILGSAIPATVSGAFVVEYIFAIPGMGKLTVDSFLARDFPVIFAIVLLISLLTLIGSWISDVAYHIADPRFRINSSKA